MLKHIPFTTLFTADHGWLKSRFHFSFAEYRNPDNINFGALRVMNDDLVQAHTGFGKHPHNDMEIITYVLRGKLTHEDSMGNKESLERGAIQYMSAGTGIIHSEMNEDDEEAHFIQTWIIPNEKNLKPQYGSKSFDLSERHNKWLCLVGPKGSDTSIPIYQDASMYASEIDAGTTLAFDLKEGRQLYIKVMEGDATINGITFAQGDAAELSDEKLEINALSNTHMLLVEMAKDPV